MRVLFLVEGNTDIRFVAGLAGMCDLTLVVPQAVYAAQGLKQRVAESGAKLRAVELPGGRALYPLNALRYSLRHAHEFEVLLAQEVTRGALAANLAGRLTGTPVFNYMGVAPLEYWACRWERRQIAYWKHLLGYGVIKTLMTLNGRLATGWLGMGPYLRDIGRKYCPRSEVGLYYGVDTDYFRPAATAAERAALRHDRDLPADAFIVFFSSRISHEKDPETVLTATHLARTRGLNAMVLNLGGGYKDFLTLARSMGLPDVERWVIGRPAAHPMTEVADYFRAADAVALASLAEGAAYSTLEALSCGTPLVATAVGGMAVQLAGHARLVPRRDPQAMAEQFLDIAANPAAARAQATRAREQYIIPEWNRTRAFSDLMDILTRAVQASRR